MGCPASEPAAISSNVTSTAALEARPRGSVNAANLTGCCRRSWPV